jgi:deoxyadenosine/deoxycytidine kinase
MSTKEAIMKQGFKSVVKMLTMGFVMLMSTQVVQAKASPKETQAKLKLVRVAYACGLMAEKITKDYLYAGNNVGVRQAKKEMKKSLKTFEDKYKVLDESINDQKSKNLLVFMQMSFEELQDLVRQPYSLDNAQIALDLSATILEGARFIAEDLRKSIGFTDKNIAHGVRAYFESIAKYYMAYQAGIKDDNTIKLMKETVKAAGETIDNLVKDPRNTIEMNQKMNKVQRLWGVVYKFYLDIDKGGLPFIVFKTTKDLNRNIDSYMGEAIKIKAQK